MNKNRISPTQLSTYQPDTYSDIDVNDFEEEPHSFTTAQLKLENWEYLNDFEDSDKEEAYECKMERMERIDRVEKLEEKEKSFYEGKEKSEMDEDEYGRPSFKNIKIEEESINYSDIIGEKDEDHCGSDLKTMSREKEYNISSLKSISFSVCYFVKNFHRVRLPDLITKFIEENPQNAKNLRRRMYDVINVLVSVDIIKKRGTMLFRSDEGDKIFKMKRGMDANERKQERKIDEMKLEHQNRFDRIMNKKAIIAELEAIKRRLTKLYQRNMVFSNQFKDEHKIKFPLVCYVPNSETFCKVSSNSVKVSIKGGSLNKEKSLFFYEKILSLLSFKRNKEQIAVKVISTTRPIKGINITKVAKYQKF